MYLHNTLYSAGGRSENSGMHSIIEDLSRKKNFPHLVPWIVSAAKIQFINTQYATDSYFVYVLKIEYVSAGLEAELQVPMPGGQQFEPRRR